MITDIKVLTEQVTPTVQQDGVQNYVQQSALGELFTVDWRQRLLRAGCLYRLTVGTITVDDNVTRITGGGGTTFIELEQPEMLVSATTGFLIPVEIRVGLYADLDADRESVQIIAIADRHAALQTASITGTAETPVNMLDGGPAFGGRVYSAITADITDPVVDEILDYETLGSSAGGTPGTLLVSYLKMNYEPDVPSVIAAPGMICVYWGGFPSAASAIATLVFGYVPASYFPL